MTLIGGALCVVVLIIGILMIIAGVRAIQFRSGSVPVIVESWSPGEQTLLSATFQFSSAATDGETIMNEVRLLQSLGQVSASDTGQVFRDFRRGHVREMICEVMAAEVTELCGPKHAPSQRGHYCADSSPGRVLYEGEREDVVRPRVREKSGDGLSHDVELASYQAAKNPQQLHSQIIQAIVSGVSTRGVQKAKPSSPGVGRSNVSRLWQEAGRKFVEQLRNKGLNSSTWCVLMLDGIRLSSEQTAVVALGIDSEIASMSWISRWEAAKAWKFRVNWWVGL